MGWLLIEPDSIAGMLLGKLVFIEVIGGRREWFLREEAPSLM